MIVMGWLIYRIFFKRRYFGYGYIMSIIFVVFSILFSPTPLLARSENGNNCGADMLSAMESAGNQLANIIPTGKSIYWNAGSVVTPLAYVTHADLHPPQLNGDYSFRRGGDRDLLEKQGLYNEESLEIWRAQDDFFLIGEKYFNDFWRDFLDPQFFLEHPRTIAVNPCQPDSAIRIFERLPTNHVNKN
jgi:hypothetical protein